VESVKWTREGRYIATTFRHVIPTIDLKDAGLYYCEADNGLGQNGKAELNIIVLHEPRVAPLGLREAAEGDDVTVTCEAAANPPPVSYEWSLEGSPRFKQIGQHLHLKSVTAASGGNYTCTVVNVLDPSGGKARRRTGSGTLRLVVRHRPGVAYVDPVAPVGVEGRAVQVACGSSPLGYPLPAFKWWRADRPTEILSHEPMLSLNPVRLGSAGEYVCQTANELGEGVPVSFQLDVVQEPRIVSGLQERVLRKAGDSGLILSCSAIGRPAPALTWFKDGKLIELNDDRLFRITISEQQQAGGSAVALTNVVSTLRFSGSARPEAGQGVLPSDAGEFTCQFENTVGSAQSAVVLKVEHAPIVVPATMTSVDVTTLTTSTTTMLNTKVAADLGETVRLTCRMAAFPAPSFSWERSSGNNGSPLRNSERYAELPIRQVGESAFESVLEVRGVEEAAFGDYLCAASNAMGAATARLSLVKRGRPESPTEVRALEAEANHIILTWMENFDGGFPNRTQFRIQYRELGAAIGEAAEQSCPGTSSSGQDSGGGGPCRLGGLKQHTTYIVRVRAVNPLGESNWSEQVSITTQIDVSHIPSPDSVYYEKSTRSVSFKVGANYPLSLLAKIEAMMSQAEGSWVHLRSVPLKQRPYKFPVAGPNGGAEDLENVRVRLCLEANDLLCGAYNEASTVDKIQVKMKLFGCRYRIY
jgi:echinoid protein